MLCKAVSKKIIQYEFVDKTLHPSCVSKITRGIYSGHRWMSYTSHVIVTLLWLKLCQIKPRCTVTMHFVQGATRSSDVCNKNLLLFCFCNAVITTRNILFFNVCEHVSSVKHNIAPKLKLFKIGIYRLAMLAPLRLTISVNN